MLSYDLQTVELSRPFSVQRLKPVKEALLGGGPLSQLDLAPCGYEVCNIHGDIVARMGADVKHRARLDLL